MAKKDKNSLLNIHYSRTLTSDNLSKAANYVGEYVLKGLGTLGRFLNAGFTSPTYGTTGQVSYARNAEDAKRLRELSEASEQAIGKVMTWVSPLNYGTAVWNGHGLDARKGEKEIASWSPAWQAVGRLGELYVGPKAIKGVKATPKVVVNTAAKTEVKPDNASVDRIVPGGDYSLDNIRLVCNQVNVMRLDLEDKVLLQYCKDIIEYANKNKS